MQTAAFLNGRKSIDITDIPILFHCLWNTADVIPSIIDIVASSLTSELEKEMDNLQKDIEHAIKKKSQPANQEDISRNSPEQFRVFSFFYYGICNFPQGKCLFYKADYNYVDAKKTSDGILYCDEQKGAWIVHAIYTGAPFDYKVNNTQNIKKIKLQKCSGGIIIDNIPYAFERAMSSSNSQELFGNDYFPEPTVADNALSFLQNEIVPGFEKIQRLFADSKHLFLSDDDKKIVKKYLDLSDKRIKELEVVIINAQQLL